MYRYPAMSNYLSLSKNGDDSVLVRNGLLDEETEVPVEVAVFLKRMDGKKDPVELFMEIFPDEDDKAFMDLIDWLIENDMVDYGQRFMRTGWLSFLFTLVRPRFGRRARTAAAFLNRLLMISFLPVLAVGVWLWFRYGIYWGRQVEIPWLIEYLLSLAIGLTLHELAHACAVLAYGGRIMEFGIMCKTLIPGAYVMTDDKNIRSPLKRVQFYAAGIEMNLLLGGVFLILSVVWWNFSFVCFMIGLINIILGIVNASLIGGIDGGRILEQLLGIPDFFEKAKSIVFSKKKKKRLRKQGAQGRITVTACYIITAFQLVYPFFIISMFVGWFNI